jgi:hypothetical protein
VEEGRGVTRPALLGRGALFGGEVEVGEVRIGVRVVDNPIGGTFLLTLVIISGIGIGRQRQRHRGHRAITTVSPITIIITPDGREEHLVCRVVIHEALQHSRAHGVVSGVRTGAVPGRQQGRVMWCRLRGGSGGGG